MKKVVLGAVVAGATAVAIKRLGSFGEGAKEPIHIRSDKHDPTRERRPWAGQRMTIPVNAHYCGEVHMKGDLCVEDLFLDPNIAGYVSTPGEKEELLLLRDVVEKLNKKLKDADLQLANDSAQITRLNLKLNHERTKLDTVQEILDQAKRMVDKD